MTDPLLYAELASWFHLLTAPADYEEEARTIAALIDEHSQGRTTTLLELGSGGGNTASHLKKRYQMTLVDRAPDMLETSKTINGELPHVIGDMRNVRLGYVFDAVLIHDAIQYQPTREDVIAALRTAAAHLRSGGVLVVCPDDTFETFQPSASCGGHDGEGRSMRYLMWTHELDADGSSYRTTFVYALRAGDAPARVAHEEHHMAVYPRAVWIEMLEDAGFRASVHRDARGEEQSGHGKDIFVGVKVE